jgi:transcription antitermination protein NusB
MSSALVSLDKAGRTLAFQGLYALEMGGLSLPETKNCMADHAASPALLEQSFRVVTLVSSLIPSLDIKISSVLQNWRIERLAKVDKNLIRLGCYELQQLAGDTKDRTDVRMVRAISCYVDIIKEYGDLKSSKFVNGVLDALWRSFLKANSGSPEGAEPEELVNAEELLSGEQEFDAEQLSNAELVSELPEEPESAEE